MMARLIKDPDNIIIGISAEEYNKCRCLMFGLGKTGQCLIMDEFIEWTNELSSEQQMELLSDLECGYYQYLLKQPQDLRKFEDFTAELVKCYNKLQPKLIINHYLVKIDGRSVGCRTLLDAAAVVSCDILKLYAKTIVYRVTTMQVKLC